MSLDAGAVGPHMGSAPSTSGDISARFTQCIQSLARLLALLNHPSSMESEYGKRITAKALVLYGRMRTWGEETRAVLPARSRSSLDEALRKHATLKETVRDILAKIDRQVEDAIRTTRKLLEERPGLSQTRPPASIESDEDTEPSSDESESARRERSPLELSMLFRTVRHMGEDIRSLYQVSLLISRPGFNRRYVQSTTKHAWSPGIECFANFDLQYVEDKVKDWRQNWKLHGNHQAQDMIATPEVIQSRTGKDHSFLSINLIRRLATSNTNRRDQLRYWMTHPDEPFGAAALTKPSYQDTRMYPEANAKLDEIPKGERPTTTLSDNDVAPQRQFSEVARTTLSKNAFSNVVESDIFGAQLVAGPARTIYEETTMGDPRRNHVPRVPGSAFNSKHFECPYCHLTLNSIQMQKRLEWKRHVFRDLRPYVCTFEDCQNPDKQYTTRSDWRYHEIQMHQRRWICEEHELVFPTSEELVKHIKDVHAGSVAEHQYPVFLELSERACAETEILPCPLCLDELRLKRLRDHVAEHLESIALFVLPKIDKDEAEGDGWSRGAASGRQSSKMVGSRQSNRSSSSPDQYDPTSSEPRDNELFYCIDCEQKWILDEPDPTDCPDCGSVGDCVHKAVVYRRRHTCPDCGSAHLRNLETGSIYGEEVNETSEGAEPGPRLLTDFFATRDGVHYYLKDVSVTDSIDERSDHERYSRDSR